MLLDHGADVNAQVGGFNTALEAACCGGHEQIIKLLLANGAKVTSGALAGAISLGHKEIIQLYFDKSPAMYKNSALGTAASWSDEDIVQLLLDRGAEVATDGLVLAAERERANRQAAYRQRYKY